MTPTSTRYLMQASLIFAVEFCLALLDAPLAVRLFFGIVTIRFLWKACTTNNYFAHPVSIYILMSAFYVFAALSEVALFGNRLNLDAQLMGDLADMGVAFLFFTAVGFLLATKSYPPVHSTIQVGRQSVILALFACSVLYAACFYRITLNYGLLIGSVSRADLYADELASLTAMRSVVVIWFGLTAAAIVTHERQIGQKVWLFRQVLFALLAIYAFTDLLVLGDRRLPLVAMLGVLSVMYVRRPSIRVIASGIALASALILYGFVRNTPPESWASIIFSRDIFMTISPVSTEFGGMAIIGGSIVDFDSLLLNFPTYKEAWLQIVPQAFVENRPLSPTEWFITSYFPDLAAMGASYAFNQVIEARINFGFLGIALVGAITGVAISMTARIRPLGISMGLPIAIHIFAVSMRMDFASILRTSLIAFFSMIALTLFMMLSQLGRNVRPV